MAEAISPTTSPSPAVDVSGLVEALGDAVVISDADGRIVTWNPAAERIFGFSEAEAMGEMLDLITPERHRRRHWDGYAKTMRTGQTRYGTTLLKVPALHKDGHTLSIAFTVSLLFGADGDVSGIVAVIRDETERFEEERRLRRRMAELEEALGTLVLA
ncbi:histidine kinase [Methylobacterium sp. Leaf456]|uniref:PAS domain-containing protein n=1 Tax=Methylobacterium sp. Leaf456 TaxID=1736382 RepID=UPI0006F60738|nr:PAS domain-containing protein [Methylobacterium sp. Leaf456]KQT46697.1 histidine kinase [Methylobacterium sp. Leaf456]